MRLETQIHDGVGILRLQGRFVTGSDAELVSAEKALEAAGVANAVVDLSAVPYVDSTGLAFVVDLHKLSPTAAANCSWRMPTSVCAKSWRSPASARSFLCLMVLKKRRRPSAPKCCVDIPGVVRGSILLLAIGAGRIGLVSDLLAAAIAFPDHWHRRGRRAGIGLGDRHFAGAGFAAGLAARHQLLLRASAGSGPRPSVAKSQAHQEYIAVPITTGAHPNHARAGMA